MKKLLLTVLLSVLFTNMKALTQPFKSFDDTARYLLKEIEARKDLFIGNPFKELTKYLKLKIVDCSADPGSFGAIKDDFAQTITFRFNIVSIEEWSKSHYIVVDFQSVPPLEVMYPLFYKEYHGMVTVDSILNFCKNFIVKDIVAKDYYYGYDDDDNMKMRDAELLEEEIIQQQQDLIDNPHKYIGKPFSELYNTFTMPPYTVRGRFCFSTANECSATFFYGGMNDLTTTRFTIEWETPIPKEEARQYSFRDYRVLDEKELAIYKNRIIKGIKEVYLPKNFKRVF